MEGGTDYAETVDTLVNYGQQLEQANKTIEIKDLHDHGESIMKIIRKGQDIETVEISKTPKPRALICSTVESFLAYLNSNHAAEGGLVSVSGATRADLAVGKHVKHDVGLEQKDSPELKGLMAACTQRTQRDFHAYLRNYLNDTIQDCDVFAAQIASVKVKKTSDRGLKINSLGIVGSAESKDTLRMVIDTDEGEQEFNIGYEWTWTGRFWTCSDKLYSMRVIFNMNERNGELVFWLSLPEIDDLKDQATRDLAKLIRDGVTNEKLLVLEGTL